jgi:hypothetical protein
MSFTVVVVVVKKIHGRTAFKLFTSRNALSLYDSEFLCKRYFEICFGKQIKFTSNSRIAEYSVAV